MEFTKNKLIEVFSITSFFMGGMWLMFFINNILLGGSLSFGVHPRVVGIQEFFGINFSWIFHGNFNHIMSNSIALIFMIPMIAFFERRPWLILWSLVFISGLITWCLGSSNSNHIGASGLIFAIMGYIFTAAIFAKKFQYWIPILISGSSYWFSIKTGLVPQEGVSFAGHLGGLVGGVIIGLFVAYESNYKSDKVLRVENLPKAKSWSSLIEKKKWYQWSK